MKIQWLQNKKYLKGLALFSLIILAIFSANLNAFAFGGKWHFEKVDYGNKPFESAEPVKIKSGKVRRLGILAQQYNRVLANCKPCGQKQIKIVLRPEKIVLRYT